MIADGIQQSQATQDKAFPGDNGIRASVEYRPKSWNYGVDTSQYDNLFNENLDTSGPITDPAGSSDAAPALLPFNPIDHRRYIVGPDRFNADLGHRTGVNVDRNYYQALDERVAVGNYTADDNVTVIEGKRHGYFWDDLSNFQFGSLLRDAQHGWWSRPSSLDVSTPTQSDSDVRDFFSIGGQYAYTRALLNTPLRNDTYIDSNNNAYVLEEGPSGSYARPLFDAREYSFIDYKWDYNKQSMANLIQAAGQGTVSTMRVAGDIGSQASLSDQAADLVTGGSVDNVIMTGGVVHPSSFEFGTGGLDAYEPMSVGSNNFISSEPPTAYVARAAESMPTVSIGNSGYRSMAEFSDAVTTKYQTLYDQGYSIASNNASQGLIPNTSVAIGSDTDAFARVGLRDWLTNVEGIPEGPGEIIQVNRRLYNPSGSGAYRVPDVYIPGSQTILDGSLSFKTSITPQIKDFGTYSGGANTIIIRPSSLPPTVVTNSLGSGTVVGSYGIVH